MDRVAEGGGPAHLAALVREGVLDPELAALAWLLVEANVPAVVVGEHLDAADRLRTALLDVRAPGAAVVVLSGAEESFRWLPEAAELGWRPDDVSKPTASGGSVSQGPAAQSAVAAPPGRTIMVADLVPQDAAAEQRRGGTWGERALVAIRALSLGYGMLATMRGERLEDVLTRLAARPVGAIDDELTRLGLVLVLAPVGDEQVRVVAAHYMRPVSRDAEGHIHRFAPAVLATWDARTARFEHFSWAISDELAGRVGITAAELERQQTRRADMLRHSQAPMS